MDEATGTHIARGKGKDVKHKMMNNYTKGGEEI